MMSILGGGSIEQMSIFSLGVGPYITASIIIELLAMDIIPALAEMAKSGRKGRQQMNRITRYVSVAMSLVQGYFIVQYLSKQYSMVINPGFASYAYIAVIFTAGSMFTLWLADQIQEYGVGSGSSMIIFAGIVCSLPTQIASAFELWVTTSTGKGDAAEIRGVFEFLLYIFCFLLIIAFVTFIELSKRKIPVQHSGKGGGQTQSMAKASFLPIKINSAGVIPVIFASSIMMAPSVVASFLGADTEADWLKIFQSSAMTPMGENFEFPWGLIIYLALTITFTFFYANIQINPQQLAENFQKNGSYIPGIRPGNETERYVKKVLNRVTFIGAMALAVIAALPAVLTLTIFKDFPSLALGGTGLIIVVGVALELNSQINGLLAGKSFDEVVAGGGQA